MPSVCAVAGCKSVLIKEGPLSFHSFPKDEEMRSKWVNLCKRNHLNPSTARICGRHFEPTAFERNLKYELLGLPLPPKQVRFKPGALPTLHLPPSCYNILITYYFFFVKCRFFFTSTCITDNYGV